MPASTAASTISRIALSPGPASRRTPVAVSWRGIGGGSSRGRCSIGCTAGIGSGVGVGRSLVAAAAVSRSSIDTVGTSPVRRRGRIVISSRSVVARWRGVGAVSSPDVSARSRPSEPIMRSCPESSLPTRGRSDGVGERFGGDGSSRGISRGTLSSSASSSIGVASCSVA
jgi:hypothetical protein